MKHGLKVANHSHIAEALGGDPLSLERFSLVKKQLLVESVCLPSYQDWESRKDRKSMVECVEFSRTGFIMCSKGVRDFWAPPEETGDYALDCALGRKLARQFITRTAPAEIAPLLPKIMEAMGQKGHFGGVEVGFLYEIGATVARKKGFAHKDQERAAA